MVPDAGLINAEDLAHAMAPFALGYVLFLPENLAGAANPESAKDPVCYPKPGIHGSNRRPHIGRGTAGYQR